MIVTGAEVYAIKLPLKQPFVVAYGEFHDMPSIVVRIITDEGVEGWGEAVPDPFVTGESFQGAFAVLRHELLACTEGLSVFDTDVLHQRMNAAICGNPSAKAALDIAFHDAMARTVNVPLFALLGGLAHKQLTQPYVISIKSPDDVGAEAASALEMGFTAIKLKVGRDDGQDIRRIRSLHDVVGDRAKLCVDANQGWKRASALDVIAQTSSFSIQWYEQPLPADQLEEMSWLRNSTSARIMIDEGVHSPSDALRAITLSAADMINVKLMKAGGIKPSLDIIAIAEASDVSIQIGSMVESAIATMAGIHVAFSKTAVIANELVGPAMFSTDIAALSFPSGIVNVPKAPGLGIDVDLGTVEELSVARYSWTPL